MPAEDGSGRSVVDDVAGGGELLRDEDVGAVVADSHGGVGAGDEFADEDGEGAEESWDTDSASEFQSRLQTRLLVRIKPCMVTVSPD